MLYAYQNKPRNSKSDSDAAIGMHFAKGKFACSLHGHTTHAIISL